MLIFVSFSLSFQLEYDPNPLLSLKRKRPSNSTALSSHEAGGSVFSELNPVVGVTCSGASETGCRGDKAAER